MPAPAPKSSQLKRARGTPSGSPNNEVKKPRRSERLSVPEQKTPVAKGQLPSPITNKESTDSSQAYKEVTATPPGGRPNQLRQRTPDRSPELTSVFSSPPQDTQAFSQYTNPKTALSEYVKDEEKEGVWGYLLPLNAEYKQPLIMRKRSSCSKPPTLDKLGEASEQGNAKDDKAEAHSSGGYLIGRHPECDLLIEGPIVSNRHCLIFEENKGDQSVAVLEDLSSNGTFVNEALIGRNKRRELKDNDEITILDKARFLFRYPQYRETSAFQEQYEIIDKLGKGHFAEVYLCVEKSTGQRYAVKVFTKNPDLEERSKTEGLQQEIAVLMGVSHPTLLCLKATFDEKHAVYLVLELAVEGELFNLIILKQKLSEDETRKVFVQLFEGIKYLHERNIVHRDIKPENILLTDKDLHIKIADFGLAKIVGEDSFTTTLCGTPSYVAPEILEDTKNRRYSRAVDIWSLGVVLYICLCGFPPFSDELYTREAPYTLHEQIKMGRFDYPSPYWDPVSDLALELIDNMLTVDVNKRYTIDDCLAHPWTTQRPINLNDSTDGLVSAVAGLDFSKRKVARERTLLASINDVMVSKVVGTQKSKDAVKVFVKNPGSENKVNKSIAKAIGDGPAEARPADNRKLQEFMAAGGLGDSPLFADDEDSQYAAKGSAGKKR
ncbi:hypothetical protein VE01_03382 [Pseudogymnoascus verrucosus]|uniref:Uncharacterized protein n=1 Tax=Pseudogymnoascus verrucosus TaxID=342668 RepID=A0A1B8GSH7_9PEZI|nr:uncharacterized protein VE01_03382 [Pseudogymnoascus verrucosus]OBT98778.1 hypothetical protein VE01_03382 [Pseudogymnoascus verrucosus]